MKLLLDAPTWYSTDKKYVANVKETDITLVSEPVDLSQENTSLPPSEDIINTLTSSIIPLLHAEVTGWFTTPLTIDKLQKKLKYEFPTFDVKNESKWVTFTWAPKYVTIEPSSFKLVFNVISTTKCNPRIPLTFLDSDTPKARSPVELLGDKNEDTGSVRNVIIHNTPPAIQVHEEFEGMGTIPYSEGGLTPLELRDNRGSPLKQKLRQAKLRSAIARLRMEEAKERYIRHYGGNISDEEYDDDLSYNSEQSETSKNL